MNSAADFAQDWDRPLRIAFAAAEVAGFAKTGGLADVAAALPRALAERSHDCTVFLPLYRCIRNGPHAPRPTNLRFSIPVGNASINGSLRESRLPGTDVRVILIEQPDYFERDDAQQGKGIYQYTLPDGRSVDYPDNCARFVFFCRAILEALRLLQFWPDVLHLNDWHTGLVPAYLKSIYANLPDDEERPQYQRIASLLTIHNVAYQGVFPGQDMALTGLPASLFNYHQLEFYGHLNFLKGGIALADRLTSVSPTYALEIQTPTYGGGLSSALYERRNELTGIVNGVDYHIWNPATDPYIAAQYNRDSVAEGKAVCKQALQRKLGLPPESGMPLLAIISRLAYQKGWDLLRGCIEPLLQQNLQLVVLGSGNSSYRDWLQGLIEKYPDRMALHLGIDERLAHEVEAGADMLLMPSLFEPCGLNQLYSLKYGTVPIVRRTGGLADTVVDADPAALDGGTATGFVFQVPSPQALLGAAERALLCYHTQPLRWLEIQRAGMRQDWSWDSSAAAYESLYRKITRR